MPIVFFRVAPISAARPSARSVAIDEGLPEPFPLHSATPSQNVTHDHLRPPYSRLCWPMYTTHPKAATASAAACSAVLIACFLVRRGSHARPLLVQLLHPPRALRLQVENAYEDDQKRKEETMVAPANHQEDRVQHQRDTDERRRRNKGARPREQDEQKVDGRKVEPVAYEIRPPVRALMVLLRPSSAAPASVPAAAPVDSIASMMLTRVFTDSQPLVVVLSLGRKAVLDAEPAVAGTPLLLNAAQ